MAEPKEKQKNKFSLLSACEAKGLKPTEDQKALLGILDDAYSDAVEKATEGLITTEEFHEKMTAALVEAKKGFATDDELNTLNTALKAQGIALQGLKSAGKTSSANAYKSVEQQIREHIEGDSKKAQEFKRWKEQKQGFFEMDIKAITMTVTDSTGQPNAYLPIPQFIPGYIPVARRQPFLRQYLDKGTATSPVITWINQGAKTGTATFIGEGVSKAQTSDVFANETSTAKKVASFKKVSMEFMDDIAFAASFINNELRYENDIAVDAALLSGDGAGTDLKGITGYVGGFVITGVATTTPNNYDALLAAATQIRVQFFEPTMIFLNPIDAANMELTKTTQGQYLLPPFSTADGRNISGCIVVANVGIPQGSFLIGDANTFHVYALMGFIIKMGWINDDFQKNLMSLIGEQRFHAWISNNEIGAWVYDTFANVKTAIAA